MDHDRLFKELLTHFFSEFIELFLPDVVAFMDRDHLEFLDKEIFTDIMTADRHEVDLLVKARFRGRGEVFFLIHVENQSSSSEGFGRRMFKYFARLHEKYGLPVFPVVLFSHDKPHRAEPDRYQVDFPNFRVLDFAFRAIQLNRLNWRDYLRNPNPVASALMTKMNIAPEDRPRVKLECLRMLATLKLDKARSTLISVFMESYLKLTAAEQKVYNKELDAVDPVEREVVMKWTNEWIEQGKAEGLVEGRVAGLVEGRVAGLVEGRRVLVLRQLRRRIGPISQELAEEIGRLSAPQIDALGEALLDFKEIQDVTRWLGH